MKINEVEKELGITKANIRFYEKEGLVVPQRSENGYRIYGDGELIRLKKIIILRKLGLPVQTIGDIFDGVLPLQAVLKDHIAVLQEEIEKLNGSLELSCQLQRENAEFIDTERYWKLVQEKEKAGYRFQNLLQDYMGYMGEAYTHNMYWFWFLWEADWKRPMGIFLRCSAVVLVYSLLYAFGFQITLTAAVWLTLRNLLVWAAVFFLIHIPLFMLSRKNKKLAEDVKIYGFLLFLALSMGLVVWVLFKDHI